MPVSAAVPESATKCVIDNLPEWECLGLTIWCVDLGSRKKEKTALGEYVVGGTSRCWWWWGVVVVVVVVLWPPIESPIIALSTRSGVCDKRRSTLYHPRGAEVDKSSPVLIETESRPPQVVLDLGDQLTRHSIRHLSVYLLTVSVHLDSPACSTDWWC